MEEEEGNDEWWWRILRNNGKKKKNCLDKWSLEIKIEKYEKNEKNDKDSFWIFNIKPIILFYKERFKNYKLES